MTQLELIPNPSPGTPERVTAGRSGEALKTRGMQQAAENRALALRTAQHSAKFLAGGYIPKTITIDDVFAHWEKTGFKDGPKLLGNAAGMVFKESCWQFVSWVPSTRPSNHGRPIRSWRLK